MRVFNLSRGQELDVKVEKAKLRKCLASNFKSCLAKTAFVTEK